jgi:nucleotidyltransferase substrate binding protein (TIGR01987 family)
MKQDIRWKQRFNNYLKAYKNVDEAYLLSQTRKLSKLEQQGLIQSFEFTHELAWNMLKDYLEDKGISGLIGSKDATRSAFKNGLIENGENWMKMITDRNLSTHTYDSATAEAITKNITDIYYHEFKILVDRFTFLYSKIDIAQ